MTELHDTVAAARASESSTDAQTPPERKRAGYPRGLASLAFTEFWERFSFYGLQAVLIFYMLYAVDQGGLALDAAIASSLVGAYGGSVYLAQILGSWMGDRVLAPKWLVFWGGVVITLGHLALGFIPGYGGLAIGLGLIVLGTGALKTNITSIVGMLLEDDPSRRDAGFSYFYMAINIGATVGALATGLAQSAVGFQLAFTLASIGMVAALIQYCFAMRRLPADADVVRNPIPLRNAWRPAAVVVLVVAAIAVAWVTGVLNEANMASVTGLVIVAAAVILFVAMFSSRSVTSAEKTRLAGFVPIFIASAVFFGLLFQVFSFLPILISDDRVDLQIGDWSMPPAWVLSVGALSAVLITPVFARLWSRRDQADPNPSGKFAFGLVQLGLGHVFLLVVVMTSGSVIALLPVLVYVVVVGTSEVLVGPIGLSLATRIAPQAFRSQVVALIFLTLAAGSTLAGLLGQLYTAIGDTAYLTTISALGIGLGAVLWLFRSRIDGAVAFGLPSH
ncbi:peptide transporter [Agromyces sp. Root81]|uniref:peptide MFS transporter n=1 Tax=Agromyces sp. Root81 TaxID=1736601 RepID=UPI0006F28D5F|nr:oligopeptide:H+ symporter [Agromyces sp. Root81]KRC61211.1 peptide transporter [Agromyces sp. Root81]